MTTSNLNSFWPIFVSLKKIKVGLWDHHAVCVSPLINFWMAEPIALQPKSGVFYAVRSEML
jgi:hypothetical protein